MREDWEEVELGELGEIITGGTPSKAISEYYSKNDYPFFKPTDLNKGYNITESNDYLSDIGFKNSRSAVSGSVLVTCIGATIGKTGLIRKQGAFNQQINAITPHVNLICEYLYYQIISPSFQEQIKHNASSTTLPILNKSKFSKLPIRVAPLPEQRAIVAKIEELFSSLDQGVADLKKAQDQLKVYRQAVLKKAFEGELTKKWREENRTEWVKDLLGNILKVSSGKGLTAKNMSGTGYPVYGGNGINGYHSEYNFNEEKLIIGRVGVKCGVTHITKQKSWVTDNALVVRFNKPEEYNLEFMKLKLQFENLNKLSSSTAQPVVSGVKIYAYEIEIPPIEEQHQIVREIESRLSVCDKVEESISLAIERSKNLRQSILKKAFEGQLLSEVELEKCKQANDYEPASELLKRIKKEKK